MNELLERKALLDELTTELLYSEDEADHYEGILLHIGDDLLRKEERIEVEEYLQEVLTKREAKVSEYFKKLKEVTANDNESKTL